MNIALTILVIWQLESSSGKNLNHKDGSLGHLGVKQNTLDFVNQKLKTNWQPAAMQDKDFSFTFERQYIRLFLKAHPEAKEFDILAMHRAGWTGRLKMTDAQFEYCLHGMRMLEALKAGRENWRETR